MLHAKFDISDVSPVDKTDAIVELAGEVLEDYGPGTTRIQRMAQWIVYNVGEPPIVQAAGALAILQTSRISIMRASTRICIDNSGRREFSAREAREISGALIRAAELADDECH